MDRWQEETLRDLSGALDDATFVATLSKITENLGFEFCAYGARMPVPVAAPRVVMLNNYPAEWQAVYAHNNYLAVDPIVALGASSLVPVLWSDPLFADAQPFWDDARDHGLRKGWSQSCFDARGVGGMLSLARSHGDITQQELLDKAYRMSWLAQATHQILSARLVTRMIPEAGAILTSRESEVLRWTADGRTSSEVSDILSVSERTVNFHVNNVLLKLNALNKTAAVIKATMLGML